MTHSDWPFAPADERREAIHWRVEALLNAAERIERMTIAKVDEKEIRLQKTDLCWQAAWLFSDICGKTIRITEDDAEGDLNRAWFTLKLFWPVLRGSDTTDDFWHRAVSELEHFGFGDEPEIFRPAPRSPGSFHQPAKLAKLRLAALSWAQHLKRNGVPPAQLKKEISLAFGSDFEAIRKWRGLVEKVLGDRAVEVKMAMIDLGYEPGFPYPDYLRLLHEDGENYRILIGLSPVTFEDYESATRKT